jgi:hypothetical protein
MATRKSGSLMEKHPPYKETTAEPSMEWELWLEMLELRLSTINANLSEDDKLKGPGLHNEFLLLLGGEGYRIARTDPILSNSNASWDDTNSAATKIFKVESSEIRALYDLFSARQVEGELIQAHLAKLKNFAKKTKLGDA